MKKLKNNTMLTNDEIQKIIDTQEFSHWSIQRPWANTIAIPNSRPQVPRDFLYTREVGGSFVETYWSMLGIPPTNGISDTIRRKMESGNFYEAIVVWVFKRSGILKETQGKVRLLDDPRYLPVYGRLDILAGHDGDWDRTRKDMQQYFDNLKAMEFDFPFFEMTKKLSFSVIETLSQMYPNGLSDKIYEVKSLNSNAFWRNDEPIQTPYEHHVRQLTFYQLYNIANVRPGSFLYIDRDSMSISEVPNIIKEDVVKEMFEWMDKMKYYYDNKIEPPVPEIIKWDIKTKKFAYNWEVKRSMYKDKILNGKSEFDIAEEIKKMNKEGKEKMLMKSAFKGETMFGNKKYKTSLELLKKGMPIEEIVLKTGVSEELLLDYMDKVHKMGEPLV